MNEKWTTIIKSKSGWFDINFKELFKYKDLILLFVKRNYITRYKQTILGPLWLILNPLITVILYSVVFGNIAGLSTEGSPQLVFYMASNSIWSYFALCLTQTSNTFSGNAAILGKVYFPRLTMPISAVLTGLLDLGIQTLMLLITLSVYALQGIQINISKSVVMIPFLIIQVALLGLGVGIIISSLTTKYRDLVIVVTFGVQLWMYASPVVYSVSQIPPRYMNIYMLNPMAPIITCWRHAFIGTGEFPVAYWMISWCITLFLLIIGVVLFNKIEKTFMDTV
ncbi:ABC transporter permease [Enterocloster bolteae]|uniref:ABC transporter permease n=1 Tax=Enterocloster bolteae TaxID=208479 RepID=UPI002A8260C3|nr:ABC transporter permease [Enterocloster bolteae]